MIEDIIRNYLISKLSVDVYADLPASKPDEYVAISRASQYREDFIDHATVHIWSKSTSLYKAAQLDKSVRDAMEDIIELDSVSHCELNDNYNDTDTGSSEPQYRSEFDLVFYEG